MIECPSCRTVFDQQPNYCEKCGHQLATNLRATTAPPKRSKWKWVLGIFAGFFFLLAFLGHLQRASEASQTVSTTGSRADSPKNVGAFHIGETAKVVSGDGYWPCGSSKQALDEMTKWANLRDEAEVKRVMVRTASIGLREGLRVKILDYGGIFSSETKVRVIANSEGNVYEHDEQGTFLADPRIGRECWIVNEALTR